MTDASNQAERDHARAMVQLLRGGWIAQAISVFAQLGLADLLADGPKSAAGLAARVDLPERALYRLLRALASVGIVAHAGDGFALTPLAATLRSEIPGSLRPTAIVTGEVYHEPWGGLLPSLRTGEPAFRRLHPEGLFGFLFGTRPELGSWFQQGMANRSLITNAAVAEGYDFAGMRRVIDIGGGNGSQLAAILHRHPELRGTLFDLPDVLPQARANLDGQGLHGRYDLAGGDFFAGVPAGSDAYLLRWILHDYNDADAERILRAVRAAVAPGGRLLVVEQVLSPDGEPASVDTAFLDLHMLLLLGGQERTEAEFAALFARAGFTLARVLPLASGLSLLEAIPTDAQ